MSSASSVPRQRRSIGRVGLFLLILAASLVALSYAVEALQGGGPPQSYTKFKLRPGPVQDIPQEVPIR